MVTICYAFVRAKTKASLQSTSTNLNSMDGNSSMRSTKGKLEIVINFQDDVSWH
jgi:hypothetical protein